jgi:hypothetical protein
MAPAAETRAAAMQAAEFTGRLWAAISAAGGTCAATAGYRHFTGAFSALWLAGLGLPTVEDRPPGQPVALLDDRDEFERHYDSQALCEAYAKRPRTLVYEDINRDMGGTWYALTARHLGRLAGSRLEVVCSVFQSAYGDESLGAHWDTWYGAIVQMRGAKDWRIGKFLLSGSHARASDVTTRAGDILLIPKNLPHAVTTPENPGYSAHLSFAIDRDTPATGLTRMEEPPGQSGMELFTI